MKYPATRITQALFIEYQRKVSVPQQPNLLSVISKLVGSLSVLFDKQGGYLDGLYTVLKRVIDDKQWTCRKFLLRIVDKIQKEAKTELDIISKEAGFMIADALTTLRQLFDGDEKFFRRTFPLIEKEQIGIFRRIIREITINHISVLIMCIEKELTRQQGIFRASPVASADQSVVTNDDADTRVDLFPLK